MELNLDNLIAMRERKERFEINDYVEYVGNSSRICSSKKPTYAKIIECPKDSVTHFCLELEEEGTKLSTTKDNIRVIETTEKNLLKSYLFVKEEKIENNVVVFYFNPDINIYYSPAFGFFSTKGGATPEYKKFDAKEFYTRNISLYNINDVISFVVKNSEDSANIVFKKLCL